jgi:cytochrome c
MCSLFACGDDEEAAPPPPPPPKKAKTEVKLCDNHTTTTVDPNAPKTPETGQAIADALMSQWRAKHPDVEWVTKTQKSWTVVKPFDNEAVTKPGTQEQTYGQYSKRDVAIWAREAEIAATEGARVFHNADVLGSTIAVSCDMCHPDAANTHPETYPKFQVQLGRVVLLRDMINWCIEHPLRGAPMAADDPRMRALEAYILAQRKGMPLAYGKH